ncbi:helix-turn-helix domain-containing protein [Rhodopseudomonas pseudopalustris]|uniref:hypothetical protein n=1 Tax=Rhodopseudomonas pseudopalustris TaxID=1513892 RepID=UPI003F9E011E
MTEAEWPLVDLTTNLIALPGGVFRVKPKCAELYSILLAAHPKSVSADELIFGLWGQSPQPPELPDKALGAHLWHLRRLLEKGGFTIDTLHCKGYVLLKPGAVPKHRSIRKRLETKQ